MDYIQTSWRPGSVLNHGMTADEYFYDQVYKAVELNVKNQSLPFFNPHASQMPIELSTGKIISDKNLIALEQVASNKGYKSNVWIYGSELEKLRNSGIRINLKRDSVPVLCQTRYADYMHLKEKELYIADGGDKTKNQFLYNFDCLDERTQKSLEKYYDHVKQVDASFTKENFQNYLENVRQARTSNPPELQELKETLRKQNEGGEYNFAPVINAHAKHICVESTGSNVKNSSNENQSACYALFEKIIADTNEKKRPTWKVGEAFTRAMDAGTWYAKSYTSKNFNHENKKIQEETHQKQKNLSRFNSRVEMER